MSKTKSSTLTQELLKTLLQYDPDTGLFISNVRRGKAAVGKQVGHRNSTLGYVQISIGDKRYYAHRLAWLYMTGEWPIYQIDHVDYDRSNNRFSNLREATKSKNMWNRSKQKNNTSGYKGVIWDNRCKAWVAQISSQGKYYYLGTFFNPHHAARAYDRAALRLHGKFASPNFADNEK